MTSPHLEEQLRHVVEAATLAPSVHNTQPWRFVLLENGFELHADPSRGLPVLDPTGRQLHISCGAALLSARVSARALGLDSTVEVLPDRLQPGFLARLVLSPGPAPDDAEIALALAVLKRHTVRGPFESRRLAPELLEVLRRAAEGEGAMLRALISEGDRVELEVLLSGASAAQEQDPDYRAETAAWVRPSAAGDGIPVEALAPVTGRGSSLRLRDFALADPEHVTGEAPPVEEPDVVVLSTVGDGPHGWLCAGQALGAVLLHAAEHGVQAQPLGQVTDLPATRLRLAAALGLVGTPQMVLRLGYAEAHAATPRRELGDVLV